jgi:hypothetical protein
MVSFAVCVLMSVKSHGVLRFRALTSRGALRDLFPDVLEVLWCASLSCPEHIAARRVAGRPQQCRSRDSSVGRASD